MHILLVVALLLAAGPGAQSTPASSPPPKPFDCSAPQHRQFDFWIGEWEVVPNPDTLPAGTPPPAAGQKPASNVIVKAHDGCVLVEHWTAPGQTGQSFNIYDRTSRRWHQTWVDSGGGLHEYWGTLEGANMVFYGEVPLGPASTFAGAPDDSPLVFPARRRQGPAVLRVAQHGRQVDDELRPDLHAEKGLSMIDPGTAGSNARRRAHPPEIDTVLYESPLLRIGRWRCPATHPCFVNSGPITEACFVFPREPVWIAHEHERAFVADANIVTYYNTGQCYERRRLGERGDRCEWFSLADDAMRETLAAADPASRERDDRPFNFTHGPSDPASYLLQRTIVEHVMREPNPDRLFVEESALEVFSCVTALACRPRPATGEGQSRSRIDLAEAARSQIASRFAEGFSLAELARAVGTSVFHLSRLFHEQTGFTLHAYRTGLRLRAALERIAEPGADLLDVALDLGFSSHSHFTETFRRRFGQTPSAFQRRSRARAAPKSAVRS